MQAGSLCQCGAGDERSMCSSVVSSNSLHRFTNIVGEYTVPDTRNAHSFDAKVHTNHRRTVSGHVPLHTLYSPSRGRASSLLQGSNRPHFPSDSRFPSRGFGIPCSPCPCAHTASACTPSATQTERQHKPPDCSRPRRCIALFRSPPSDNLVARPLSAWRGFAASLSLFVLAELLITPLGLALLLRSAPPRFIGLATGLWYAAGALGYFIGGEVGVLWSSWPTRDVLLFLTALPPWAQSSSRGSLGTELRSDSSMPN